MTNYKRQSKDDKLQMANGKQQTESDRYVRFKCFCWLSWLLRNHDLGQEFPHFGQNCPIGSCRISLTEDAWIVGARWEGWFYGRRRGPRSVQFVRFSCETIYLCRECVEARWKRWFYGRSGGKVNRGAKALTSHMPTKNMQIRANTNCYIWILLELIVITFCWSPLPSGEQRVVKWAASTNRTFLWKHE